MIGVREPLEGVHYLPEAIAAYYAAQGALADETLAQAITASCARWPDRAAVTEPGVTISYAQLDTITDRVAASFIALGLKPLDRVLFQVFNSKELLFGFLGCLKAGIIPICTLAAHRASEIGQIGRQAGARAHFISQTRRGFDLVAFAQDMRSELPSVDYVIATGSADPAPGVHSFEAMWQAITAEDARVAVQALSARLDPFQVCMFQLSGGTSGTPKIIPRMSNEYAYSCRSVARWHGFDETLVAFTPNPMLHNAAMACFWMPALLIGGEVAIAPASDLAAMAAIVNTRSPNWCMVSLVHVLKLKEIGAITDQTFAGAYGFICMEGAREFSKLIGAPAFTIYGMTEGLLSFTRHSDPALAVQTTVGRPLSEFDEVRLVEPNTERDVQPGATGELIVRGPSTIIGYHDAHEHNVQAFTSDGYYRSGDLMSWRMIDGRRYLRFEGRVKDVIDRGGEKINCSEIELALGRHPKVSAVMCVGMPDPIYGERMCAFIMLNEGHTTIDLEETSQHLTAAGLAKFKFPERIEIVTSFPIGSSGKVSKPMMRDMIASKLAAEAAQVAKGIAA